MPPGNRLEALKGIELVTTVFGSTTNGEFASFGGTARRMTWRLWTITEGVMRKN